MDICKKLYHGNQQYKGNSSSIEHIFRWKGEHLTYINLNEVSNDGKPEYRDPYPDEKSFR